jgi:aspartyl-tRNA(Asn)/glutamyl-tRNA(Gln) amidotransferase subunit C
VSNLNRKLFQNLSELSRIDLSEEEQESLREDLKKILDYVEQLHEVDTEGVKPCNHVLEGIGNVMREDTVRETLCTKKFLDNAPDQINGMIKVPSVIRKTDS